MSEASARLSDLMARTLHRERSIGRASMTAAAAVAGMALVSACTVGPDYERPAAPVPAVYKEQEGWKPAQPREGVSRGPWWSIYDDPVLDELERQIDISNQNLKASEAAFRQALAVVQAARAGFFPTLVLDGSAIRSGSGSGGGRGGTRSTTSTTTTGSGGAATSSTAGRSGGSTAQTTFTGSVSASWDLDVWGRIRRTVESDVASAQVSAADLALARLSAQAALATDYFELRVEDELKRLLDATAVAFAQSLQIARNQYNAGIVAKTDVAQAETQLMTTQAQAINVGVARAQLEHAIAVLIGKPPAESSIAPTPLTVEIPSMPAGLPSTLLERRPDIAAAERQMAAANAQIGVAVAAFYPDISLSGTYGYSGSVLGKLIQAPNSFWSVGGQFAQTLFDAGLRSAQVDEAHAFYEQSIANYRQTVLTGFQQVEDNLAALRILAQQAEVQDEAVKAAQEATRLTLNQYKAGTVAYTSVVVTQTAELSNEETALTIRENRLTASVALIQALGGGWDALQLPTAEQVEDSSAPVPGAAATPAAAKPPSILRWFPIPLASEP